MDEKNYFQELYDVDVREKTKQKNGLNYLSWAAAWAEVKKKFPDATFKIYEQTMDDKGNTRPWFDDGRTGWVKTGVTINGMELIEELPIMDFRNKSIPADSITSTDANKSIQRSLTKAKTHNDAVTELCKKYVANGNPKRITNIDDSKALLEELKALK